MKKWAWDRRGRPARPQLPSEASVMHLGRRVISTLKKWFALWGQYWFTFKIK